MLENTLSRRTLLRTAAVAGAYVVPTVTVLSMTAGTAAASSGMPVDGDTGATSDGTNTFEREAGELLGEEGATAGGEVDKSIDTGDDAASEASGGATDESTQQVRTELDDALADRGDSTTGGTGSLTGGTGLGG